MQIWSLFSKVNEYIDSFHIPYYNKVENRYSKFFPDFIFWIKLDNEYRIIFVDPKGLSYTDYLDKVDEFERLFMVDNKPRIFNYKGYNITFELKLIGSDVNRASNKYREYWLGNEDFSFIE